MLNQEKPTSDCYEIKGEFVRFHQGQNVRIVKPRAKRVVEHMSHGRQCSDGVPTL